MARTSFLAAIIACLIGLAALIWAENELTQSFQTCVTKERSYQSANNANKGRFIVGRALARQSICTVDFLDRHNGFITALAGIAVACFTFTLWSVSRRQADIADRALIDLERAFVFIKEIEVVFDREPDPPPGSIKSQMMARIGAAHPSIVSWRLYPIWANSGSTPARRLMINLECSEFPERVLAPRDLKFTYTSPADPSFIGPKSTVRGQGVILGADVIANISRPNGRSYLYIWGYADYDDMFEGTPRHRTEFCFRVDVIGTNSDGFPIVVFPLHREYNGADDECMYPPVPYVAPESPRDPAHGAAP